MSRQARIEGLVREAYDPLHLEVTDESHLHSVPEGAESHFKLLVVSERFAGQGLVARHRALNRLLSGELESGLHALALHTWTPDEWYEKGGATPSSPPCLGGSKAG
jgi:BolA protein